MLLKTSYFSCSLTAALALAPASKRYNMPFINKINQRPRKAISALKKATVSVNGFEWHRERKTFGVSLKKHVLIFFYFFYLLWLSGKGQKPKTHKWYHFSDHTEIKPITAVFRLQRHAASVSLSAAIELFSNTWKTCSGAGLMSEE